MTTGYQYLVLYYIDTVQKPDRYKYIAAIAVPPALHASSLPFPPSWYMVVVMMWLSTH